MHATSQSDSPSMLCAPLEQRFEGSYSFGDKHTHMMRSRQATAHLPPRGFY